MSGPGCQSVPSPPSLLLVAPSAQRPALADLLAAYRERRIRVTPWWYRGGPPVEADIARIADGHDAALVIGPRTRSPRTVLSGPVLYTNDDRAIPAGWLPYTDESALRRFAATTARVHRRAQSRASIALLAQRHPRYLRLADRMGTILGDRPVYRWTADALVPEAMIRGLGSGLGSAIYFGHGRPIGWVGYYGLRAHHFDKFQGEPLGAMLSLCCDTASRRRTGLSFAEALPLQGVCAGMFAAVGATLHVDNTRWAVRLSDGMLEGARTLGSLVRGSLPPNPATWGGYRIIGDPLAPLRAPARGCQRAAEIEVFV
jgi:hypothetical protein